MVEASNPVSRRRQLVGVGLELEVNRKQVAYMNPGSDKGLPCVLGETENAHYWLPAKGIAKTLIAEGLTGTLRLRGMVRDSYGEEHYGDWMKFDPTEWAQVENGILRPRVSLDT